MPPPPLSRLVRELSHVSVDYFVPRPGTALSASQDASQTLRPRHAPDMRLRSRSRSHRCAGQGRRSFSSRTCTQTTCRVCTTAGVR
jgi:hypothetical protein